jgi:hypothetical protein
MQLYRFADVVCHLPRSPIPDPRSPSPQECPPIASSCNCSVPSVDFVGIGRSAHERVENAPSDTAPRRSDAPSSSLRGRAVITYSMQWARACASRILRSRNPAPLSSFAMHVRRRSRVFLDEVCGDLDASDPGCPGCRCRAEGSWVFTNPLGRWK